MKPAITCQWVLMGWCLSQGTMAAELQVVHEGQAQHEKTGITVVSGSLALPPNGYWVVPNSFDLPGSITQIFLQAPSDWMQHQQGRRLMLARQEKKIKEGRYPLHRIRWALEEYARHHDGIQATTLQDLPEANQYGIKNLAQSPYENELDVKGAAYALLSGRQLHLMEETLRADGNAESIPLVVELQPYLNDGQHWVLHTDGRVRRIDIDTELMTQFGLKVTALQEKSMYEETLPSHVTYQVYGLKRGGVEGPARFQIQNVQTQEMMDCTWQPTGETVGQDVIRSWANLRGTSWFNLVREYDAPILKQWGAIQQRLYGTDEMPSNHRRSGRNRGRQISMFGVLGGQAALQETFQLQGLDVQETADTKRVPIDQIEGVAVESHPFTEMLAGQAGGRLALAEVVPEDCLLVHFAQPQALQSFLVGGGSDFLSHLGSLSLGRSLDYDLVDRFLDRLGLSQELLQKLMQLDAVQECAAFTPDLFFIDGTDVGIVARAPQLQVLTMFLKLVGLELSHGKIVEMSTAEGGQAYWCLQGDLVFISTQRGLLERALQLHHHQGQGSLGQSDEFRYMLTQLSPTQRTWMFLYFSDPFIRRLVSPATKIGQLRRLQSRVNMNQATSAALLYQLDQQSDPPSVARLMKLGYLPADFAQGDVQLEPNLMAVSQVYGPNRQLKGLTEIPLSDATAAEAQAYQGYVEAYRRYWRQYFDPVAVRLDETQDGGLELTTFILPLLDSWFYTQIREFVPGQLGPSLSVPQIDPVPVALFSLNLNDKMWTDMIGGLIRSVAATDTSFVDDFGPALHVAIQDADPVLAFGGGDLLDIAGQVQGFDEMLMIPVFVSLLTRPCAVLIETQNPEDLTRFLEQGGLSAMFMEFDDEVRVENYRIAGRDAWTLCIDLFGMAKIRFGVEVQGHYLVVTNQPWSQQLTIQGTLPSPLNDLALHLEPAAAQQQLAAMFTSATEKQRRAAMQGNAMLVPLIWSGTETVPEALVRHQQLFGFVPKHPGSGTWCLNEQGTLASSVYGVPGQAQQAGYQKGEQGFGLLQGISPVDVSLQIEDTGLRTRIYWKCNPQP